MKRSTNYNTQQGKHKIYIPCSTKIDFFHLFLIILILSLNSIIPVTSFVIEKNLNKITHRQQFQLLAFNKIKDDKKNIEKNENTDEKETQNGNMHQDDEEELEFPTWVRALRQWPLYPTSTTSETFTNKEVVQDTRIAQINNGTNDAEIQGTMKEKGKSFIPFENIINLEALLMASGSGSGQDIVKDGFDIISSSKPIKRTPLTILPTLEELRDWDSKDTILKDVTSRVEEFVSAASTAIPSNQIQDLITRASQTLTLEDSVNNIVAAAEKLALEQGLNVSEAAFRALETTKSTQDLVNLANGVLVAGYVHQTETPKRKEETGKSLLHTSDHEASVERGTNGVKPLFSDFETVSIIPKSDYKTTILKAAEMGSLSGAIYEDTIPKAISLGHSIVANGTNADVRWMVTDSIGFTDEFASEKSTNDISAADPMLVRTITIRGFDASDEEVDREKLVNVICTATPDSSVVSRKDVELHAGLLSIAREIYDEVIQYIDTTGGRIVLNGHSVGGSIAALILLLLTEERGAAYVRDKVLRVFTFGSPPVATLSSAEKAKRSVQSGEDSGQMYTCDILDAFDLPSSIVYGYVQPFDPIIRLFSEDDGLYPLVDDIGEDGFTPWASGPPRTLRPIVRAIAQSWDEWPRFRDNYRSEGSQNYISIGQQHLLLPEPVRYLSDRLVSANLAVPPIDVAVRVSSRELLPALKVAFPLDVYVLSFVPAALRGFIHHFYPAYGEPIVEYAKQKQLELGSKVAGKSFLSFQVKPKDDKMLNGENDMKHPPSMQSDGIRGDVKIIEENEDSGNQDNTPDWTRVAAQWILSRDDGKGE